MWLKPLKIRGIRHARRAPRPIVTSNQQPVGASCVTRSVQSRWHRHHRREPTRDARDTARIAVEQVPHDRRNRERERRGAVQDDVGQSCASATARSVWIGFQMRAHSVYVCASRRQRTSREVDRSRCHRVTVTAAALHPAIAAGQATPRIRPPWYVVHTGAPFASTVSSRVIWYAPGRAAPRRSRFRS